MAISCSLEDELCGSSMATDELDSSSAMSEDELDVDSELLEEMSSGGSVPSEELAGSSVLLEEALNGSSVSLEDKSRGSSVLLEDTIDGVSRLLETGTVMELELSAASLMNSWKSLEIGSLEESAVVLESSEQFQTRPVRPARTMVLKSEEFILLA